MSKTLNIERPVPVEGLLSPALHPDECLDIWLAASGERFAYSKRSIKRRPYKRPTLPATAVQTRTVVLPMHICAWLDTWAARYGVSRPEMLCHLYESYLNLMAKNPALVAPLPVLRKFPWMFSPATDEQRAGYLPGEEEPALKIHEGEE